MYTQTFLKAADGRPLAKRFSLDPNTGEIVKHSYPHVRNFTSHEVEFETLRQLYDAMRYHAKQGACLLKGELNQPLFNQSRAGSTDPLRETLTLFVDVDGLKRFSCGQDVLDRVGKPSTQYIEQLSASSGIVSSEAGYFAHLFGLLERPCTPAQLKLWMKWLNLTIPEIREQLTLTRSRNALKWPLDVTINQADKLNFLSDPICENGIVDPNQGKRFKLYAKRSHALTFSVDDIQAVDASLVKKEEIKALNECREEAGLPRRTLRTKRLGQVQVASSPTQATVTSIRDDDTSDFVYINLNGGDSFGYFFSRTNPEVLYNFKGEQNYALADLAPELYEQYKSESAQHQQEKYNDLLKNQKTGKVYLAFLEPTRDAYYRGYHDRSTDELVLDPTQSMVKLVHFLKANGAPVPEVIPEWRIVFDPSMDTKIDVDHRIVNTYNKPPLYADLPKRPKNYPSIQKLIAYVLGTTPDSDLYAYHFNWLANRVQNPDQTSGTAWLLHGVQGTGKNVFFDHVIRPLFGHAYCTVRRFEEFEEQFNSWVENTLMCLIDEAQADDVRSRSKAHAKLKNYITEPVVVLRGMRQNPRDVRNRVGFYIASNKKDPLEIEASDRRMNIADYQRLKAEFIDGAFLSRIREELPSFARTLLSYAVNEQQTRVALESVSKEHLKYLTTSAFEQFTRALRTGDFMFFLDNLPSEIISSDPTISVWENTRRTLYASLVKRMYTEYINAGKKRCTVRFSRDELMATAKYLIGKVPDSPNKFTSFAKHHDLHFKRMRVNGRPVMGYEMEIPHIDQELLTAWEQSWGQATTISVVESNHLNDD